MNRKELTVNGNKVNLYEFAKCETFFGLLKEVRELALEINHKRTSWVEGEISTAELIEFVESVRETAQTKTNELEVLSLELSGILRESYETHVAINRIKELLGE